MSRIEGGATPNPAVGATDLEAFAAGLGHELSNLAAALSIRLECVADDLRGGGLDEDLEAMHTTLEKARRLSDGLRFLAAEPAGAGLAEAVSLRGWWASMEPVLRALAPRGAVLEGEVAGPAADLMVSPVPLSRITFGVVGAVCRDAGTGGRTAVRVRLCGPWIEVGVTIAGGGPTPEAGDSRWAGLMEWIRSAGGEGKVEHGAGGERRLTARVAAAAPAPPKGLAEGSAERRRVFVGVKDARTRALIVAELAALACDATSDPGRRAACEIEVLDAPGEPRVGAWKVVLLAEGSQGDGPDGAVRIGRAPSATVLRETLRRVVLEPR